MEAPMPDTADLGDHFYQSIRAASDAYEAHGHVPPAAMNDVLTFSAAIAASHDMAKVKRLKLIIEALEEIALILDERSADDH